jgi:methylated-DNA-[protein]-cysteine S-methyltransferase
MKAKNAYAAQTRIETALGPMLLAADAEGLAGAWFAGQRHHPGPLAAPDDPRHPELAAAAAALCAYLDGRSDRIELRLAARGTPFQHAVWQALLAIPRGTVASYREIAARVGRPAALRAVGAAVGRNPLSVVVPCHRVLASDGSLGGYAGGVERKRALLALEGVLHPIPG